MSDERAERNDVTESKRGASRGARRKARGEVKYPARLGRNQTEVRRSLRAEKPLNTDFTEALWSHC
jgi:hypothetical protein